MRQTQRKGDIAVAQAIATFTRMGYDVAVPLTESAPYDLVVLPRDIVESSHRHASMMCHVRSVVVVTMDPPLERR
jgi:hypothetical protein